MKWTVCLCAALLALLAALVSSKSLEPTPWEDQNADSDALAPAEPNALSRNKRIAPAAAIVLGILAIGGAGAMGDVAGLWKFKRTVPSSSSTDEFNAQASFSDSDLTEFSWDLLHNVNITKRSGGSKKPMKGRKGRRPRTTPAF